jgi:CelD/BcsL family acetyltransferase involved in cellulose biosynthesis
MQTETVRKPISPFAGLLRSSRAQNRRELRKSGTGVTGYDPLYRDQRAGTYLLVRMLEDACADPAIDLVDYGFGDAEYKRNFGDRSWQEADVLVYAATLRGLRTNLLRTSVGGAAELARRALRKASAVARVKRAWRDRLRRGHG